MDVLMASEQMSEFTRSSTEPDIGACQTRDKKSSVSPILEKRATEMNFIRPKKPRKRQTRARLKVYEVLRDVEDSRDRSAKIEKLRASISSIEAQFKRLGKPTVSMMPLDKPSDETVDKPITLTSIRFQKENEAQRYFQRHVRIVIITLRWINHILRINNKKRTFDHELKSFTDIAFEFEESEHENPVSDSGLTFDRNYFKCKKEITLSEDIRRTLTTRSESRTKEMLKQVMHGLQTLKSLAEYPLHIQEKLCHVAWYQQVEPKKAILRQGHYAESFYFILSGKAFVKKMARLPSGETEMRTLARLGRGQSFGEIALLYRTERTATVESAGYMELLVIGRDDFIRIFTNGEGPDDEPDHVQFLRNVPVIRDWPLKMISKEPGSCILHYFKRGTVVTLNNQDSEWIYIVKAGYCDVLKRLNAVKARSAIELSKRPRAVENVTPQTCGPVTNARIDNGSKRRKCFTVIPDVYNAMAEFFKNNEVKRDPDLGRRRIPRPIQAELPAVKDATKPPEHKRILVRRQSVRVIVANYTDVPDEPTGCRKSPFLPLLQTKSNTPLVSKNPPHPAGKKPTLPNIEENDSEIMFRPKPVEPEHHASRGYTQESVFVCVGVLRPKDIFGINTLQLEESSHSSTPVCLVSRGAELILLSKKLFLRHIDDTIKRTIQNTTMGYPRERIMQENLQQEVDWKLYKQTLVGDYVSNSRQRRVVTA